ncbi:D-ribitol-5-phosphate cytidylyltransferase [Chionoecetes opilio]|uniref:D-ribitol-5-phosphate cytidylyltransferase n=1 Tax=Chionoecetes opilio TaxID=41210 RepID=A0A8J4Y5A0_CHIOP|nr:D-ribitol-5-phosphate cytidylyltransferase [Chionoecetes opilio]
MEGGGGRKRGEEERVRCQTPTGSGGGEVNPHSPTPLSPSPDAPPSGKTLPEGEEKPQCRVGAVVPAAGNSERMGSATPKQYMEVCGSPLVTYCLEVLQKVEWVSRVVVVADDLARMTDVVRDAALSKVIVVQSRPELLDKLGDTIGNFEMAVTPRSLFATDGTLLILSDKSSFMKEIESYTPPVTGSDNTTPRIQEVPTASVALTNDEGMEGTTEGVEEHPESIEDYVGLHPTSNSVDDDELGWMESRFARETVIIIDGQAVVQDMKKLPGMHTISDLTDAFDKRIDNMMNWYSEGRIISDRYITGSMKEKTRSKRAGSAQPVKFIIQDTMNIRNVPMKLLLSHNMSTHNHEEADTQIPLHVIDAARQGTSTRDMYVWSPDTDVFLLLIDLVANHTIPGQLKMLTGRAKFFRTIDIKERCTAIGTEKSKALIGLHNFTGADWGGKFFSISKKAWIIKFLQLPSSSKIIKTFQIFGCSDSLPEDDVVNVETFVCSVYSSKSLCVTLPALRWELFKVKNLEGEKLPPTRSTLKPHIQRANLMSKRDKTYQGGGSRHRSIRMGVEALAAEEDPPDVVVVHDGARPLLPLHTLTQVAVMAERHGAAGAVRPLVSTVVMPDTEDFLQESLVRSLYRNSEMPQAFRLEILRDAYRRKRSTSLAP